MPMPPATAAAQSSGPLPLLPLTGGPILGGDAEVAAAAGTTTETEPPLPDPESIQSAGSSRAPVFFNGTAAATAAAGCNLDVLLLPPVEISGEPAILRRRDPGTVVVALVFSRGWWLPPTFFAVAVEERPMAVAVEAMGARLPLLLGVSAGDALARLRRRPGAAAGAPGLVPASPPTAA